MARSILFAGMISVGLAAPGAASGQVTDAGAREIEAGVAAFVDTLVASALGTLAPTGPVVVTPAGESYRLTIPAFTVTGKDSTVAGLDATITPTPEGWLAIEPTLGNPLLASTDPARPVALTVEHQSGGLTYAPAYRSVMAADFVLEGIALIGAPPSHFEARSLGLTATADPVGADRYDQSARYRMRGFDARMPDGTESRIESMQFGYQARSLDFAAYADLLADAEAAPARDETGGRGAEGDLLAAMASLAVERPPLFDDLRLSAAMEGMEGGAPGAVIRADRFWIGAWIEGARAASATLGLEAGWRNLATPPALPGGAFLASDVSVELALRAVPNADLAAALWQLRAAARTMDLAAAAGATAGAFLPVLLHTDGIGLDARIGWTAAAGALDLDATLHAAPASPYLVAGTATLKVDGLDQAIVAFGADTTPDGVALLRLLTTMRLLGTETTDAAGRPWRTYDVELGPQGEVVLNGTDVSALLRTL